MKKFFGNIKNAMKKLWETITNKWLLKGTTTIILVALVIVAYIGINWLAEEVKVEDIDFTAEKLYSLSDETRKRVQALDEEIIIQLINMDNYTYVTEYADKYENASKKITVEEIDNLTERVDLQTKYNIDSTGSLIVVKNGDKEKTLAITDLYTYISSQEAVNITEEAITNAIIEVTIKDKPHIYVLSGKTYYEPGTTLGIIANQLMDEANEIELLDILTKGNIPEDCDCLIITTLAQDLSELERDEILKYINNGGKIMMLTSQTNLDLDTPNLDQVLAQYGITLDFGVIFEQDSSKKLYDTPNMILADVNASFMNNLDKALEIFIVSPGKISFADDAKLEELGVVYEVIASTSEKSFVRTKFDVDSNSRTDSDSEEGANVISALVTKKISEDKTSELIIYTDETFITPIELATGIGYMGKLYNNEDVVMNSISYLTDREDTITIRNTYETETYTVTDQEDAVIKTIIFVVPILIIGAGIVVMFIRKRAI